MSVTSIAEIKQGRSGKRTWDGSRTYMRVFRIMTDNPADSIETVGESVLLPAMGAGYPSDRGALVTDRDFKQQSDYEWLGTFTYQSHLDFHASAGVGGTGGGGGGGGGSPGEQPDNPLSKPYIWRGDTVVLQEGVYETVGTGNQPGLPIQNKAGEAFPDPLTRETGFMRLSVTGNVPPSRFTVNSLPTYQGLIGTYNQATHFGFRPGLLKFVDFNFQENFESAIPYITVSQSYLLSPDQSTGWTLTKILNAGFNEKTATGLVRIVDKRNFQVNTPYPLGNDGKKLPDGAEVVWLYFPINKPGDWVTLPLH